MAMTNVQRAILDELQNMAGTLVTVQQKATALAAMYANENMATLVDGDFQSTGHYQHITAAEFQAAIAALSSINAALNAGTPAAWARLLKIMVRVP